MVKISVIMPLYNAARYLEESLRSIQKQTFTDFELICINDASTDSTMEILMNWQKEDHRIRLISNQKNCGAAFSRNRGMKEADGVYLSFLDGDDIFEEEMLETAYRTAEEYRADVVMYEPSRAFPSQSIHNKIKVFHSMEYVDRYCKNVFSLRDCVPYEFMKWRTEPSDKLYRKEFIQQNRIFFQDLSCENDTYFVCMALMLSERLVRLKDTRMMVYKRDHNELTRISYDRDPKNSYLAFVHLAEELSKRNKLVELYPYFYYRFVYTMKLALRLCKTKEKEQVFYQFLQDEGFGKICSIEEGCCDKLDDYIKGSMNKFKNQAFESQWYRQEEGLKMELSQPCNAQRVKDLLNKYKNDDKKVCIWGAGANGVSLLKFCKDNNLHIDVVVDKAESKQGCIVEGYMVKGLENIENEVQVIIITARYIFESVMGKVAGCGIEVVDINQFLVIY